MIRYAHHKKHVVTYMGEQQLPASAEYSIERGDWTMKKILGNITHWIVDCIWKWLGDMPTIRQVDGKFIQRHLVSDKRNSCATFTFEMDEPTNHQYIQFIYFFHWTFWIDFTSRTQFLMLKYLQIENDSNSCPNIKCNQFELFIIGALEFHWFASIRVGGKWTNQMA